MFQLRIARAAACASALQDLRNFIPDQDGIGLEGFEVRTAELLFASVEDGIPRLEFAIGQFRRILHQARDRFRHGIHVPHGVLEPC